MSDLFGSLEHLNLEPAQHSSWSLQRAAGFWHEGKFWLAVLDLYRELGSTVAATGLKQKYRKDPSCVMAVATHEWNSTQQTWERGTTSTKTQPFWPCDRLEELVTRILKRVRKTAQQKQSLAAKVGVSWHEDGPIECEVLDYLIRTCPLEVQQQYRIGDYRVDAYIPRLKLVVQIDEKGHRHYDPDEEKKYDTVLRDHGLVCCRFIPDETQPSQDEGLKLVRQIWQRTLSPDFQHYSRFQL